jgi:CTP synthase
MISERHRHRFEVNNAYRDLIVQHGLTVSGTSPDGALVEMVEITEHPWFIGGQFHPELKSRPTRPHPLFASFIEAAARYARQGRAAHVREPAGV